MWELLEVNDRKYLTEIADMARSHYGKDDDTAKVPYLEHEYFSNPAGTAIVEIAYDREHALAVSQCAAVPVNIKVGEKIYRCLVAVNVLTRESHRRQGVFQALGMAAFDRASREGFALAYSMPNPYSYPGFIKHLGFSELGRVPLYVRPLVPSQLVKSFLHSGFLSLIARAFDGIFRIDRGQTCTLVDFRSGQAQYAESFWQSVKDSYPVLVLRDQHFLSWRYTDHPCRTYQGYYALSDGRPVAFVIGRNMEVSGIPCAMVADYLFVDGFERQARTALNQLLTDLQEDGAQLAGCMVPKSSKERYSLKKAKFFKCPLFLEPQPFRFILRQMELSGETAALASDLNNWFFTLGDYDIV